MAPSGSVNTSTTRSPVPSGPGFERMCSRHGANTYSPSSEPSTGVTIRSWYEGRSTIASAPYSKIVESSVEYQNDCGRLSPRSRARM